MQVRNHPVVINTIATPVSEPQSRPGRLPPQQQAETRPAERVIQGELLTETGLRLADVVAERARVVLQGQARAVNISAENRPAIQTYLDIEAGETAVRPGVDIVV